MKHKSPTGSRPQKHVTPERCGSALFNCHMRLQNFVLARSVRENTATRGAHLHVASKGVVAVELAHVSVAGVFRFSVDQNVSGKQSHFSPHVNPIDDLSDVAVLWLP